jgi:branched-subunit amino acid ABC-type transport system permease component
VIEIVIQALVYGVFLAAVYGVIAMGFNLVAGIVRMLNLAHAEFIALGAYATYWLWVLLSFNPIAALPISALIGLVVGVMLYFILIKKVVFSPDNALLITFSLSCIFQETMKILWTPNYRGVPWTLGTVSFPFINFPITYIFTFTVNLAIILVVYFVIFKTYFGKAIRAVTIDPTAASFCGVNVDATLAYGFAFAVALAFVGGTLIVVYISSGINPYMGTAFLGKSIVVAVIGGLGNAWGALAGGLLVGMLEQILPIFLKYVPGIEPFTFTPFVYFVLFLIILLVRPGGLLGGK